MIDRVEYGKKVEEDNYLLTLSAPRYEIRYKFKTEMSVFQNVVDIRIYKSVRAKHSFLKLTLKFSWIPIPIPIPVNPFHTSNKYLPLSR